MYRKAKILSQKIVRSIFSGESLISENPEEQRLINQLTNEQKRSELWDRFCENDKADAVKYFRKELLRRSRVRSLYHWGWVAAVVVLMISVGSVMVWKFVGTMENNLPVMGQSITPGKMQAQLQLADGSVVWLDRCLPDTILLQAGVMIHTGEQGLNYEANVADQVVQYNTLKIPRGGEYKVILTDGTEVTLNSESELRYPVKFSTGQRRVYCSGEAYFRVAHDENRAFVVESEGMMVEVLGTEFNLNTYNNENMIYTTLVKGRVKVGAVGHEIIIVPGEQALFNRRDQQIMKEVVDVEEVIAWKNGNFVLEEQTLEQIMQQLSRWYDFACFFQSEDLKRLTFKGSVPRYSDFEKVLEMLAGTDEVKFEVKGKTVTVRK